VVASFAYVSTEVHLSRANLTNFLTYEILPWPMRREGYYEGTGEVTFALADVWNWALELAGTEVLEGMWNTLVLTQIALVGTGIFALVAYAAVMNTAPEFSSVQFSSVQDGIYALGKAHMRSTPSLKSFPNVALETVPMLV